MKKGEKEIEKIYVVRDTDSAGNKYISSILITYKDGNNNWFYLPPSDLNGSIEKQKKEKLKMDEQLKTIVSKLDKRDFKKLVFVPDHNQALRNQVIDFIQNSLVHREKKAEYKNQILSGLSFLWNLFPVGSTLSSALGIIYANRAINKNRSIEEYDKNQVHWLRKLKFYASMALLSLNAATSVKNISLDVDRFQNLQYVYSLCKADFTALKNRKLALKDLENPFESDTMFTSADAMTNVLMEAFNLNPLIEEEDRKIAVNLKQYLKENPYLNYKKLYDDFASFSIIDMNGTHGNDVGSNLKNSIIVHGKDLDYSSILEHELVHRTGSLDCHMLNEGMTSLITYEYMEDFQYTNAYYDNILMTKIFCELVTPDKMLEAYSKDDMSIIKNELLKINPNENIYRQFIGLLNDYYKEHDKYSDEGNLDLFFDEGHALAYRDKFAMMVMEYVYNADFDNDKVSRITEYLNSIGTRENVRGTIYFNKIAKELSYYNAYSSELEETSNYHY